MGLGTFLVYDGKQANVADLSAGHSSFAHLT